MNEQIEEMKQLLGNVALHIEYNHPEEAIKMLTTLIGKAQDLQDELKGDE
jgi:hypothetical protein